MCIPGGEVGCLSHSWQGDDYLMRRVQNYKDQLFLAEVFVDLLFEERKPLFILPLQLTCWPLKAILKTGTFSYVFLLKSLEDAVTPSTSKFI